MEAKKNDIDMTELEELRREQDKIDFEIVQTVAKRLAVRKKISAFRIKHDLSTIDPVRREIVLKQAEKFAVQNDIPGEMGRELFNMLIDWSHRMDRQWRSETKK